VQRITATFSFSIIACLSVLVTACTTTQVQLFTDGMSDTEINSVTSRLSDLNVETELNALPIPDEILTPTVMYSPTHTKLSQVEDISNQLIELGYDVSLVSLSQGNHFYTSTNVGLYLKPRPYTPPEGVSPKGKEFNGDCKANDAYLTLNENDTFTLEMIGWDETINKELATTQTGTWYRSRDSIVLSSNAGEVELSLIQTKEEFDYGTVRGIRLSNFGEGFNGCNFVYRLHQSPLRKNCEMADVRREMKKTA